MKLELLQYGNVNTLRLRASAGAFASGIPKGVEARLQFSQSGRDVVLAYSGRADEVEPADDASKRAVDKIRATDPPRLCWVASTTSGGGGQTVILQVHKFRSAVHWPEKMEIAVDERIVERVSQRIGRKITVEEACAWLSEKVLLPPREPDTSSRVVATGVIDERGRFRLLGQGVAVDIIAGSDKLEAERVVQLRDRSGQPKTPQFLIEADLVFIDATLAGKIRYSVRSQLDRIVSESDSYLSLWLEYRELEGQMKAREALELGSLRYKSFKPLPNGLWQFTAAEKDELPGFESRRRQAGSDELEADHDLPPELLGNKRPSRGSGRERRRASVGTVEGVFVHRGEISLRPRDEDSDALPPKRGFLFAAMQGDRTRLERQESAVNRVMSANARMPQLGLIIEGQDAPQRRVDRVPPMKQSVLDLFGATPTPAQRDAIDVALNTPDLALIQGPPGTGKTKVVAAILARLAQLESEQPEVAGRTLLSSFQHDAVDHAAAKSSVFGLPPARFGGRRGDKQAGLQARRWSRSICDHIEGELAAMPEHRPLTTYRRVRDQVAAYAAGHANEESVQSLLEELVDLPPGMLPASLWEQLERHGQRPKSTLGSGPADLERDLMAKAVRGIRTTPEAFSDDGPTKARQALSRLEGILTEEDKSLLEAAREVEPGQAFGRVGELDELRTVLLDRVMNDRIDGESTGVDVALLELLNEAVACLHAKMQSSPGGVADALAEYREDLDRDPASALELHRQYAVVHAATCQQCVGTDVIDAKGVSHDALEFENVVVDEAARANPLDLFIPMSLATRRILLVGDHRQLPQLLDWHIERELASTKGDASDALKQSLFERLFRDLQERERRDGVQRVITLDKQYRMHPALGGFISRVFYEPHGEAFESPRPAEEFVHSIAGYQKKGGPVCAAWKDHPAAMGHEEGKRSKSRRSEARWIAEEVRRLLTEESSTFSIGIIAFYQAQVTEIFSALENEGIAEVDPDTGVPGILPEWQSMERDDGGVEERLRVGTVDAFQGKEFDVVLLSVTRSNQLPAENENERRRKFGHLMLPNRLCVAMSRQRRLLVAVGDKRMFESSAATEAVPGLGQFLELCGGQHGMVC